MNINEGMERISEMRKVAEEKLKTELSYLSSYFEREMVIATYVQALVLYEIGFDGLTTFDGTVN